MIDFRYHVVSLVSVFLALAVGIVLGAGPLKEPIGNTLTQSVKNLRQELDVKRAELATANTAVDHRDAFVTTVTPTLISGQLTGRSVVIVTLPDADDKSVQPLVDAINAAGGSVTGRISLNSAWTDPKQVGARSKAVAELQGGVVPARGQVDQRLSGLLAEALVATGASTNSQAEVLQAAILKRLQSAGLIDVKSDVSGLAGAALMLAPANPQAVGDSQIATPSTSAEPEYIALATAFDSIGGGSVVTGPASSASSGGVLDGLRKDDTASGEISTVDTGSTPMGVIATVLALREQLAGGHGAYGYGNGTKQLPALATAGRSTSAASAVGK